MENSIIVKANKVMVARSAGAGSVFGYNYVDNGYINTNANVDRGGPERLTHGAAHTTSCSRATTASTGTRTRHTGTPSTTPSSGTTWRGFRRDFEDTSTRHGPHRAAGATYYSYWHSFIGNVLGVPGKMAGWVYESGALTVPAVFKLGWDDWPPYPVDARVAATAVRHGNYDYLTNSVKWDPSFPERTLPSSLYLTQKPASSPRATPGHGWIPTGPTQQLHELPAKVRFEAGTPFGQP